MVQHLNEDDINVRFPDITAAINNEKFIDASALIEETLKQPRPSEEKTWLEYQSLLCRIGYTAQEVLVGKEALYVHNYSKALASFEKAVNSIGSHVREYGLDASLAHQMVDEVQNLLEGCSFHDLPDCQKDRDEIIHAVRTQMPDSLGQRALMIMLDAHFQIKVAHMYCYAEIVANELSYINDSIEGLQCDTALANIEMERKKHPNDVIYQEHLDNAECAARTVLVAKAYRKADECFINNDTDKGLRLYEKIATLMSGRLRLFHLSEEGLNGIIEDFEKKIANGSISSYQDTLKFRTTYIKPLQEHFGSSPYWQTITMTLDAHLALRFYKRLQNAN